jgi:hypothetical protein
MNGGLSAVHLPREKPASSRVGRDSLEAGDGISEVVFQSEAHSCGRGFDSRRLHSLEAWLRLRRSHNDFEASGSFG